MNENMQMLVKPVNLLRNFLFPKVTGRDERSDQSADSNTEQLVMETKAENTELSASATLEWRMIAI